MEPLSVSYLTIWFDTLQIYLKYIHVQKQLIFTHFWKSSIIFNVWNPSFTDTVRSEFISNPHLISVIDTFRSESDLDPSVNPYMSKNKQLLIQHGTVLSAITYIHIHCQCLACKQTLRLLKQSDPSDTTWIHLLLIFETLRLLASKHFVYWYISDSH